MSGDSIAKPFDSGPVPASPSRVLPSVNPEPSSNQSPNGRLRTGEVGRVGSPSLPHHHVSHKQPSTRHSVSDLAGAVRSVPQTPVSLSSVGANIGGGCGVHANGIRRGTLPVTGISVTRSGSNGVDPFSVELDELDRMATGECSLIPFVQFFIHSLI